MLSFVAGNGRKLGCDPGKAEQRSRITPLPTSTGSDRRKCYGGRLFLSLVILELLIQQICMQVQIYLTQALFVTCGMAGKEEVTPSASCTVSVVAN